jgi:hypothetical protein
MPPCASWLDVQASCKSARYISALNDTSFPSFSLVIVGEKSGRVPGRQAWPTKTAIPNEVIEKIAKEVLQLETLETRGSDRLVFPTGPFGLCGQL